MVHKANGVDMVNGPLWGKLLKFAAVYMLTAVLQHLYAAADSVVVGRFAGQEALAAVGTCTAVISLFLNFILGVSAGGTIALGQAIGARSKGQVQKTVYTCIAVAVLGGLIMSTVCLAFSTEILNMIDVPQNIFPQATTYFRIIAIGFVPSLIYNFGAALLRAKGDTKRPLYIVTISGVINVALNLFFVCVLKMRADGVATATVISQIFTAVAILYILCNETDEMKINLREIRIYKQPFLKILKFGLPSGIQSSIYSVSNVLVQSGVNSFGSAAIAGSAAATSITSFYEVMAGSLYHACIVFSSQNFGAKKFDRIKKIVYICFAYSLGIWAIQSLVTYLFGESLIGIYVPNDVSVIEWGWRKLGILGYAYGLLGFVNIMSGALRGMGASIMNMITSICGVCGIRILWIMTAFKAIGTYESLFICYPLSWGGTFILHTCMFILVFKNQQKKLSVLNLQ